MRSIAASHCRQPPQRIVTIFASNTEMVAALGLADRIVGIEAYTRFPPEVLDKPLVGGRLGLLGRCRGRAAARPRRRHAGAPGRATSSSIRWSGSACPIVVLLQRDVAEILVQHPPAGPPRRRVPSAAEQVAARCESRLARVAEREQVAGLHRRSTIMITGRLGNGLLLVARSDTYTGDAIVRAGGRFALASGAIAQVSPEAILKADPDVLLFAGSAARSQRADRAGRAGATCARSRTSAPMP